MNDFEAEVLGRRAERCHGWRAMAGMVDCCGDRLVTRWSDALGYWSNCGMFQDISHFGPPDFRDAATLGCLLALVRDAWGDHGITSGLIGLGSEWFAMAPCLEQFVAEAEHTTEAAALVAALEAAPRREVTNA